MRRGDEDEEEEESKEAEEVEEVDPYHTQARILQGMQAM